MTARRRKRRRKGGEISLVDPYFSFLFFVAVGAGSWRFPLPVRMTLLWVVLLVVVLLYSGRKALVARYSLLNLSRGVIAGLIISLPFLAFAQDFLLATGFRLFATSEPLLLFQRLVFIAAPLEEAYFRGFLQREKGLAQAALLNCLAGFVYFSPHTQEFLAVLAVVALGMGLLATIYGYAYERYGLTASVACHGTVNFIFFVIPPLLHQVMAILAS
ncbi:MAG: type II CAAX prenyl endopeptidase Rce1 family protein [Anaerolineae bacterium]